MSSYELESLGRIMAGILRHFPEKFGMDMDEEGFVDAYKMVSAIKRKRGDKVRWLRPSHIIGLVETDPKGRYQVDNNHVRATYGHSLELSMSLPTDNIPERLYYPAHPNEVDRVLKEGLHPMDRAMVHLSKTWNDAYEAGIHREGPDPVIVRIDAEDAMNNGIIIQRAGKTVFTVEEIPSDFLSISDEEDIELARQEIMERGGHFHGDRNKEKEIDGEVDPEKILEGDVKEPEDKSVPAKVAVPVKEPEDKSVPAKVAVPVKEPVEKKEEPSTEEKPSKDDVKDKAPSKKE
ncbi:MAG: RNA 2'-phosphotransferase [Candidatus Thermoplasmatota archaeon]|nr:RNA 2'-phosphotransferase [Candidatus Thermoplasmatota archaeon]